MMQSLSSITKHSFNGTLRPDLNASQLN